MSYPVLSVPAWLALYGASSQEVQQKYFLLKIQAIYIGVPCLYPGLLKYIFEVLKVTVEF